MEVSHTIPESSLLAKLYAWLNTEWLYTTLKEEDCSGAIIHMSMHKMLLRMTGTVAMINTCKNDFSSFSTPKS
jgi:hypothetical protein